MKHLHLLIQRNMRRRILLWLPCLLFCWWSLSFGVQAWKEKRERARYDGRSVREWIDRALAETYGGQPWNEEPANSKADGMVIRIGAPAVPILAQRLRNLHTGELRYKLVSLRQRLGLRASSCPQYFDVPDDVSMDAAHIDYLLSQMGAAARPALPAMLDSLRDVHYWAMLDIRNDFVRMGSDAREALPRLREWAKAGDEDAALGIEFIEKGITKLHYASYDEREGVSP